MDNKHKISLVDAIIEQNKTRKKLIYEKSNDLFIFNKYVLSMEKNGVKLGDFQKKLELRVFDLINPVQFSLFRSIL